MADAGRAPRPRAPQMFQRLPAGAARSKRPSATIKEKLVRHLVLIIGVVSFADALAERGGNKRTPRKMIALLIGLDVARKCISVFAVGGSSMARQSDAQPQKVQT